MYTYAIFNPENNNILPDGKRYYDEVKYRNTDYLTYFKKNPDKWVEDTKSHNVFYSNYDKRSYIKSHSNPLVRYISHKGNLAKIISKESYCPKTIAFKLDKNQIPLSLINNWNPKINSLWFLKKASDLSYGGYDVFPIKVDTIASAFDQINKSIVISNKIEKYRSKYFVLQKGIKRPLLILYKTQLYKYDIRAYGLIVKIDKNTPSEYYFLKKYRTRRAVLPYDPNNISKEVMLTNTTQGSLKGFKIEELSSIEDDSSKIYKSMLKVYYNLCTRHLRKLDSKITNGVPAINIIGIDFIFDKNSNPYILEINKFPTLRSESFMFGDDFFQITFESIISKNPVKSSTKNYYYIK
jgi:hypothetical protein